MVRAIAFLAVVPLLLLLLLLLMTVVQADPALEIVHGRQARGSTFGKPASPRSSIIREDKLTLEREKLMRKIDRAQARLDRKADADLDKLGRKHNAAGAAAAGKETRGKVTAAEAARITAHRYNLPMAPPPRPPTPRPPFSKNKHVVRDDIDDDGRRMQSRLDLRALADTSAQLQSKMDALVREQGARSASLTNLMQFED